jgi:hypothetical protein
MSKALGDSTKRGGGTTTVLLADPRASGGLVRRNHADGSQDVCVASSSSLLAHISGGKAGGVVAAGAGGVRGGGMNAFATGITGLAASKKKQEADVINSNGSGSGSNGSTIMQSGVGGHGGEYNGQDSLVRSMQADHKDGVGFDSGAKNLSGSQQKALGSRPSMERFFSPLRKKPPLTGERVLRLAWAFRDHCEFWMVQKSCGILTCDLLLLPGSASTASRAMVIPFDSSTGGRRGWVGGVEETVQGGGQA